MESQPQSQYQQPGEFQPPVQRSNWPSTLGVVAIIFGILGFITYAINLFYSVLLTKFGPSTMMGGSFSTGGTGDEELDAKMEEIMTEMWDKMMAMSETNILINGGLTILAGALFFGGILLMQRKRIAKPILIGWSYAKLILGLFGIFFGMRMAKEMMVPMGEMMEEEIAAATSAAGGTAPTAMPDIVGIYENMFMVFAAFGAIWMAVLPLLFLIYLNRPQVKEEMADGYGWR